MQQIIVIPPKSMSADDKRKLTKAGHIVVEATDPSKVLIISENLIVRGNDLAISAIQAIVKSNSGSTAHSFITELCNRLLKQEAIQS